MPPISFPGFDIVVTDEMKQEMEKAGFRGITFRPVDKTRIVEIRWHEWSLTAADPDFFPNDDEPEGYILDEPHSPEMAAAIGTIWEIVVSDSAEMVRLEGTENRDVEFRYVEGSWNGNDLFSVPQRLSKYASDRAKAWLEDHAGKWVSFRRAMRH